MNNVQITLTIDLKNLVALGEFLNNLEGQENKTEIVEPKKVKKDTPKVEPKKEPEAIQTKNLDDEITLQDLRAIAFEKTKEGKKDEVLEAIQATGVATLPDVPEEHWPDLRDALLAL